MTDQDRPYCSRSDQERRVCAKSEWRVWIDIKQTVTESDSVLYQLIFIGNAISNLGND